MVKRNGVYYVEGKVNGIPMTFIFDTGASDVSISLVEASFLFKQGRLSKNDIIGYSSYTNANGGVSIGMNIIIKEFEIGGVPLKNVKASIVHNLEAPLLLGGSALNKLGKFTIDPSNSTLTVYGANNTQNSPSESTGVNMSPSATTELKGEVSVITNAPLLVVPSTNASQVGVAVNNKVTIIRKVNEKYYYVKSGSISGYIWVGWLK